MQQCWVSRLYKKKQKRFSPHNVRFISLLICRYLRATGEENRSDRNLELKWACNCKEKKKVAHEVSRCLSAGGAEHLPVGRDIVAPRFIRNVKSTFGFHEALPCLLPRAEKTRGFWGGGLRWKKAWHCCSRLFLPVQQSSVHTRPWHIWTTSSKSSEKRKKVGNKTFWISSSPQWITSLHF